MLAFSGFTGLLRYRFFVSRVHKLLLALFVCAVALNVTRRLTPAAKFCSGDHLSFEEWRHKYNPSKSSELLVKLGFILKMYVYCVSVCLIVGAAMGIYVAISLKGLFA